MARATQPGMRGASTHCTLGVMATAHPVIVYPPDEDGGQRVRAAGEILGQAYDLRDLVEFLRRAGVEDVDEVWVRRSSLIEWQGGGPDMWGH